MNIIHKESGDKYEAIINEMLPDDYAEVRKDKGFIFNWETEQTNKVYKICLKEDESRILGLLSLIDYPEEFRIHINLVEVSRINVGKIKKLENIAGCLIAFACLIAFKRGYGGFVSLLPKTELIDLYQDKYGFRQYGRLLAVEFESSKNLIDKYIGDE